MYVWKRNNEIIGALSGSANFSSNSLIKINRDVLFDVSHKNYNQLEYYIELLKESSVRCIEYNYNKVNSSENNKELDPHKCTSTSLFAEGSKINWGHAPNGHVNRRDSYISITVNDIRNYGKLFPPKQSNAGLGYADNEPIDVLWDDGENMLCLLEGSCRLTENPEIRYPNKISSYKSKRNYYFLNLIHI